MRRLFVLFLCLLMPLQGYTAAVVEPAPCPMQGMMDIEVDTSALAQAMDDCCNDLHTFEITGEACKSELACGTLVAWPASLNPLTFLIQKTHAPASPAWRTLPPGLPTSLWRPPTSI
ncbi:MAG: hypothetical protein C0453_06815 [Comamonadaceae bacterium]|nr:hypothetical protein [Comamonadaceae bacterium]